MKKKRKFQVCFTVVLVLSLLVASCAAIKTSATIPSGFKQIGFIDFSNWSVGSWYTLDKMQYDWNPRLKNGDKIIDFFGVAINNRAEVVKNEAFGGNVLRIKLPKDKILPEDTGAQFFGDIGSQEEVFFGNSIYLPTDFECGKEMKMPPGIYGGWRYATGGSKPDGINVGPSIRGVLQYCTAKSYIYHLNQSGNNDDGRPYRNPINGDKFTWRYPDGSPVVFSKGVKHEIMSYAKMNTPDLRNGIYRVWYDGVLVLSLNNLEFRKDRNLKFNAVGSEIFLGGSDRSYATKKDNTLDVSNFRVLVRE